MDGIVFGGIDGSASPSGRAVRRPWPGSEVETGQDQSAPPRPWDARSPPTSAPSPSRPHRRPRPRCISGWTARVCRCAAEVEGRRRQAVPSALPRPARSSWPPSWTAEGRDPQGRPRRDTGSSHATTTAVETAASRDTDPQPAAFAQRVQSRGAATAVSPAPRRVVLGDGAYLDLEPGRRAVSRRHRNRRPTTPSSICATQPRPSTAERTSRRLARPGRPFWTLTVKALVTALRTQAETTPAARSAVFGNRQRMRYAVPRRGLVHLLVGVVEAGCKQIGARLKPPACTGPSPVPTPSSPCAAASSADASRTSGSDAAANAA